MCKTGGSRKDVIWGTGGGGVVQEQWPYNDISNWETKMAASCLRTPHNQGFANSYLHLIGYYHKHQGSYTLIRSVSRVITVLANVSSVFQLFFFLVVCSDMILKGFDLVAFFASVKGSSVRIHLSCPVCIQSVVHGVWSRLFCGHKGCSLLEVSINFISAASILQNSFFCFSYPRDLLQLNFLLIITYKHRTYRLLLGGN
jgi:hypothetical protein